MIGAAGFPLPKSQSTVGTSASTGVSSFFLSHGYNPRLGDGIDLEPLTSTNRPPRNSQEVGDVIVQKLRKATELTQTMAAAQQRQEDIATVIATLHLPSE